MIQPETIDTLLAQVSHLLTKKRIKTQKFQLDEIKIQRGLQQSTLTSDALLRFHRLVEAYLSAQAVYGKRFEDESLMRLTESFLSYIKAINHRIESGTDLSYLALNTNEQLFLSTLKPAEERVSDFIGLIGPDEIHQLFSGYLSTQRRNTLRLPEELLTHQFQPFFYLSWKDENNMFLITRKERELLGLQLTYSRLKQRGAMPMKMGFCDFCHGQLKLHHTAAITATIPKEKLREGVGYKSVGRYVCLDHIDCNKKLLRTRREEKVAAFIESVQQNKPLIL